MFRVFFLLGAEGCFEAARASCLQALVGGAFELDILDASLLTELAFGFTATLGIHHKDVGIDDIEGRNEVDNTTTLVDIGFLDGLDILYHKQAFLLGKHGLTVLILLIGGIRTDTYIEVAKLGGLLKKLNMTAMEKVVTTRYEYFHEL